MEQLMSFRKWFLLLLVEISYLLLGACFFYQIESAEENKRLSLWEKEREEIEELLIFHYQPAPNASQADIFQKLSEYCGKPMNAKMTHDEFPHVWDFYHSLFFVITVISTIGYGNLAPTTMLGRIVMIFYALVGIPVNGIVMLNLGGFFGKKIQGYYNRWKTDKIHDITANLGLASQIILYLVPGLLFLLFLPSIAISIMEQWDYDVAVYYAFVTLTTIGFGDYVAGVQDNHFGDMLFTTYKIFLLIWIIIGLGYLVMVFGFISRGMRSRQVREMEELLVSNIRRTPIKLRALKSMVYEILLMRLKPVYKKASIAPIFCDGRSMSLPDLRILYEDLNPCRKRALSETDSKDICKLQRVHSDSNLHLIDKDLTFESKKEQQQHDMLRKMSAFVNRYAPTLNHDVRDVQPDGRFEGYDGLPESEILQSEWTMGSASIRDSTPSISNKLRSDSISNRIVPYQTHSNEVTWYGQTAALKEQEMRERIKHGRARSRTLPVQQEPLLPLRQVGIFTRIRRRLLSTSTELYKEKDIEKAEPQSLPTLPPLPTFAKELKAERARNRTQSEGFNLMDNNLFTSEEQKEIDQLAKMLLTFVEQEHDRCEPRRKVGNVTPPDFSTPRLRRGPIVPMTSRKGSLMPPSPTHLHVARRFSLNPVEDINQPPISPALIKQRRYSLRPTLNISATPSPVIRRMRKDTTKDNVIVEHQQMK